MLKKAVLFLCFFALSMTAFITYAFAYIDPSAMTYLIQIIAGVLVACGAAFTFYWRKLKRSIKKKKDDDDSDEDAYILNTGALDISADDD